MAMLLFYTKNLEKVKAIIAPAIEDYKSGKITLMQKQNLMHEILFINR